VEEVLNHKVSTTAMAQTMIQAGWKRY